MWGSRGSEGVSQATGDQQAAVPTLASPHLSPPSHPLGWAPGPQMADASTTEAFLILEVSGRSLTPAAVWGWEALVGWAAHGHLFDARALGPRAGWISHGLDAEPDGVSMDSSHRKGSTLLHEGTGRLPPPTFLGL